MVHTWCVTLMGLRTDGLKLNSLLSESASAYRQAGRTGLTFRFGDARHGARGERRQPAGPMLTAWLSSLLSSASVTHTTGYSPPRPRPRLTVGQLPPQLLARLPRARYPQVCHRLRVLVGASEVDAAARRQRRQQAGR